MSGRGKGGKVVSLPLSPLPLLTHRLFPRVLERVVLNAIVRFSVTTFRVWEALFYLPLSLPYT